MSPIHQTALNHMVKQLPNNQYIFLSRYTTVNVSLTNCTCEKNGLIGIRDIINTAFHVAPFPYSLAELHIGEGVQHLQSMILDHNENISEFSFPDNENCSFIHTLKRERIPFIYFSCNTMLVGDLKSCTNLDPHNLLSHTWTACIHVQTMSTRHVFTHHTI